MQIDTFPSPLGDSHPQDTEGHSAFAVRTFTELEMDLQRIDGMMLNRQIPVNQALTEMEKKITEALAQLKPLNGVVDGTVFRVMYLLDEVANSYQILLKLLQSGDVSIEDSGIINNASDKGFDEA